MIGVLSKNGEAGSVREFFELFKTPWEFYVPGRAYDVVIATCEEVPANVSTRLLIIYNSGETGIDDEIGGVATESKRGCEWLEWNEVEFPVYGNVAVLQAVGQALVRRKGKDEAVVGVEVSGPTRTIVRIGVDLFQEVSFLLSQGQPAENAHTPTLDIHISMLRTIMVRLGISFIEIPPVPAGYDFMGCLTHDVDFVGIRDHKFDHTMWGFMYRCFVGSLIRALSGKLPWSGCLTNWKAGLSLPLVHLGLREDFWLEFDRYMQIERGLGSTFFFIPFKNLPGTLDSGAAPQRRAAKYDVAEMKDQVLQLLKNGFEVGLHGIDAWQNSESAHAELCRIREVTGQADVGIRMHWLYWTEKSPRVLEQAGLAYDSTFGYNDAVGFRAGTTQAFCPLGADSLLELPLNIQDTAMFYSDRMELSETEALNACQRLIHSTLLFGGALTVNWHTRSLSPERLWGDFYAKLLQEIQAHRVWFGTAAEIVQWFRARRALRFDSAQFRENSAHVALSNAHLHREPSFTVRIHHPHMGPDESRLPACMPAHTDAQWNGEEVLEVAY
jgi:hypothetical protein